MGSKIGEFIYAHGAEPFRALDRSRWRLHRTSYFGETLDGLWSRIRRNRFNRVPCPTCGGKGYSDQWVKKRPLPRRRALPSGINVEADLA